MPEVHYELVKLKRNVAWKRGREEAEVLLQALLAYATTNQLAKYQEQLKGMVKLSPEKWLLGNKLSVQWTTLENLAELTKFARQEGICSKSLDTTGKNREKRPVGNALECLKSLGVCEGGAIQSGSNIWEFQLQLKSQDATENLKWLFKLGGEWDRRHQEWQRRYKNGGADEESGTLQPELSPASSPYRGLFAFGVDDAQYFFGRENFTEKLVKAVQSKPAITVIGSSGSGKSSVVFAGLIPKLGKDWRVVTFRPGDRPFHALAAKLVPWLYPDPLEQVSNSKKLAEKFRQGDSELQDIAEFILRNHSDVRRLLLVVDQFEELYTLCQEEEERKRFLDVLLPVVPTEAYPTQRNFTVVITLRADFCGQAYSDPQFTNAFQGDAHQILGSMNGLEKRRAIEEPARLLGVELQEGLTQRILDDVGEKPGSLPLLEFALDLLWKKQNDRTLIHAAYDEIGGVRKALAKHADAVYEQLSKEDRKRAQQIFTQIVCPGEGTEDTRRLATPDDVGKENWDLVTRLANEKVRLVVTGQHELTGKKTVEIIHEALIKEWERLREWMEDAREFRTWQERLRFRIAQWENSSKDKGELLRGAPLVEAQKWLEEPCDRIPEDEQAFIQASRECQEQEAQRWKRLSEEKEQQRRISLARQLAAQSQLLRNQQPHLLSRSVLLAMEAVKRYHCLETDQALRQGLALLPRLIATLKHEPMVEVTLFIEPIVKAVAFSSDGEYLATATGDGTARIWKWETASDRPTKCMKHEVKNLSAAVLNKTYLITVSDDSFATGWQESSIWVWEVASEKLKFCKKCSKVEVTDITFSPDDGCLFTACRGAVVAWKIINDQLQPIAIEQYKVEQEEDFVITLAHSYECLAISTEKQVTLHWKPGNEGVKQIRHEGIWAIALSRNGKFLATVSKDRAARLWDTASGQEINRIFDDEINRDVSAVALSLDGRYLVIANGSKTARVWEAKSGEEVARLIHEGGVWDVDFCPNANGRYIVATASTDKTARVWELAHALEDRCMTKGAVKGIASSPNGIYLATASEDGTIQVWETTTGQQVGCSIPHEQPVKVVLSPNGEYIAITSKDNSATIWNLKSASSQPTKLMMHKDTINDVAFSPNGDYVATASKDGSVKLWKFPSDNENDVINLNHEGDVQSVAFSPDGKLLAAGSFHGIILVWDVKTGDRIKSLPEETTN